MELAEDLDFIIESACEMLSEQQSLVIECLFEGPRDIVSRVLGVAPKTVDTHTARAYAKLRKILLGFVWIVPNGDGRPPGTHWSEWNARFASMEARRQRRLAKAAERRKAA